MSWIKKLIRPSVLLPVLLSAGALAAAFSLSNIGLVWDYVSRISIPVMAIVFALAFFYLVVKGLLFRHLLRKSHVRATARQTGIAYTIGEMAIPIPAGVYLENYVLGRTGSNAARSAGTTTGMLIAELLISFIGLLIVGVPGWWWLRPAIGVIVGMSLLLIAAFVLIEPLRDLVDRLLELGPLKVVHKGLSDALQGMEDLVSLRVAARTLPATALYVTALISAFFFVSHDMGIDRLTFVEAVSIYLFALAATLLLPVSANLGVIELSGVGAAQAWGFSYSEGLAMLLGTRLVWTGSVWLVGAVVLFLLRDEFVRGSRQRQRQEERQREEDQGRQGEGQAGRKGQGPDGQAA